MIINITNRHDKVSPSVREKIESWLEQSQERYEVISSAQITLDKKDRLEEVEATVHVAGREINAKASDENLFSALDDMAHKIDRQLAKHHDKKISKKGIPRHTTLMDEDNDVDVDVENEEVYQV